MRGLLSRYIKFVFFNFEVMANKYISGEKKVLTNVLDDLKQFNKDFVADSNVNKLADYMCLLKKHINCAALQQFADIDMFCNISTIACSTARTIFNTSNDALRLSQDSTEILQNIQVLSSVLECHTVLIQHAIDQKWFSIIKLANILHMTIGVLMATYKFCIESRQLFSNVISEVSGSLASLFRAGTSLQLLLHQLLDNVQQCYVATLRQLHEGAWDNNKRKQYQDGEVVFVEVCDILVELGWLLSELDMRMMAETWKVFLKLLDADADSNSVRSCLRPVIPHTCNRIYDGLELAHRTASAPEFAGVSNRLWTRTVKLCCFQLKLVMGLVEKHSVHIDLEMMSSLLNLAITLLRFSEPDNHVGRLPDAARSQLASQLSVAAEPLLISVMPLLYFEQGLLEQLSMVDTNYSEYGALSLLRVALFVLRRWCHLSANDAAWCTRTAELLNSIFLLFDKCRAYLLGMTDLVSSGFRCSRVSLYEFCLVSVCSYFAVLDARTFRAAERVLWRHLYSCNFWSCLLATDVICFVARFGPSELCLHYCRCLCARVRLGGSCRPLQWLLYRLARLLSDSHRSQLLRDATVSSPLRLMLSSKAEDGMLLMSGDNTLSADATAEQFRTVCGCMDMLELVYTDEQYSGTICAALMSLWTRLAAPVPPSAVSTRLITALMYASTAVSAQLTDAQIVQILEAVRCQLRQESRVRVQLASVVLLDSIKSRQFSNVNPDQLNVISDVYACLLSCDVWAVHQMSLESVSRLARCTPHTQLIAASVASSKELQSELSTFVTTGAEPWDPCTIEMFSDDGDSDRDIKSYGGMDWMEPEGPNRSGEDGRLLQSRADHKGSSGISGTGDGVSESGTDDGVLKSGTDDGVLKSGTYDGVLKSGTDDGVLKSGTDDVVLKSATDDGVLMSATDDEVLKSGTDNGVMKSETDDGVRKSGTDDGRKNWILTSGTDDSAWECDIGVVAQDTVTGDVAREELRGLITRARRRLDELARTADALDSEDARTLCNILQQFNLMLQQHGTTLP